MEENTTEIKINCEYTKLVPIEEIKPNLKNNNKHSEEQYKRLAKNMLNLGIRHPITVSRLSGLIVFGHARYEAFKILGLKEVPIEYQDFKDDQEEYAAMTADNALQADWAEIDLSKINLEIPNFDPSFDIELLGLRNFLVEPADKELDPNQFDSFGKIINDKCEYIEFTILLPKNKVPNPSIFNKNKIVKLILEKMEDLKND